MKIKDIASENRPRERMFRQGKHNDSLKRAVNRKIVWRVQMGREKWDVD